MSAPWHYGDPWDSRRLRNVSSFHRIASDELKVAISQPAYLPWMGYFDLIDQVDVFVLLDNVQFEKQSWQQRNRIKTPAGLQWLTVPVKFRGRLGQAIKEVEIRDLEFGQKHCRAVELNYRRSPFFDNYYGDLSAHLTRKDSNLLADLNYRIIEWFMGLLGIKTQLRTSSGLNQRGKRTELLANICKTLGATQYVSPLGSAAYLLEEQNVMTENGVDVVFQNFIHPEYGQLFPPFLAFASVLDLIFNQGERSREILCSGRREPFSPGDVATRISESTET